MKDSFLGRETEVPSEEASITSETPAPAESSAALCNTLFCQAYSLALPLGTATGQSAAPHPSEEGGVELIREIHRVLFQETRWSEAAPLSPPQGAVLHRAPLQPDSGVTSARNPNPSTCRATPARAQGGPVLNCFMLVSGAQQSCCCVIPSW